MFTTQQIDDYLKTREFAEFIDQADEFAVSNNLDLWATRVAWVGLTQSVRVARRYAQRRTDYRNSPAWIAYERLVNLSIFLEEPEVAEYLRAHEPHLTEDEVRELAAQHGVYYDPAPEWENGDGPLFWFRTLVRIAAGAYPPESFPRGPLANYPVAIA